MPPEARYKSCHDQSAIRAWTSGILQVGSRASQWQAGGHCRSDLDQSVDPGSRDGRSSGSHARINAVVHFHADPDCFLHHVDPAGLCGSSLHDRSVHPPPLRRLEGVSGSQGSKKDNIATGSLAIIALDAAVQAQWIISLLLWPFGNASHIPLRKWAQRCHCVLLSGSQIASLVLRSFVDDISDLFGIVSQEWAQ